jgi:hypothetical protein
MIETTKEEDAAIRSLQRLAKKWPDTLQLVLVDDDLIVVKPPHRIDPDEGIPEDWIVADIMDWSIAATNGTY